MVGNDSSEDTTDDGGHGTGCNPPRHAEVRVEDAEVDASYEGPHLWAFLLVHSSDTGGNKKQNIPVLDVSAAGERVANNHGVVQVAGVVEPPLGLVSVPMPVPVSRSLSLLLLVLWVSLNHGTKASSA
jgi:hypothetical protein